MKNETYIIDGMHCAACSSAVERVTRKLAGVERSDVNLTTNKMLIEYDDTLVTPDMIIEKIKKAGFSATLFSKEAKKPETNGELEGRTEFLHERRGIIVSLLLAVILLYISMGTMLFNAPLPDIISMARPINFALIQLILTFPILMIGKRFYISGFKALFYRNPNMDTLVAIGSSAAFIYSLIVMFFLAEQPHLMHNLFFESAAIVVALVSLGKHMETSSKQKTRGAITKLMELSPDTAILVSSEGALREVKTETLKINDIVLVKPGARIPLDGIVTEGNSSVDESMLTGECMPVSKALDCEVVGGSVNQNGVLYVKITRIGDDTTLSKIIKFVEDAQGRKAPISKTADKVAGVFVPFVIVISLLSLTAWLVAGQDLAFALKIFTSVLVIACPCAMGLATPTAIVVGTGLGATNGILIRSGEALEITHNTSVVLLDKTGTVTNGRPIVTEIISQGIGRDELLELAALVESVSQHPLADAIVRQAKDENLQSPLTIQDFQNISGMGIDATVSDGRQILIGNQRLLSNRNISTESFEVKALELSAKGETPMFFAIDNQSCGIISVADTIKETSTSAILKLKAMGIKVVLLTGDNKITASHVAALVGVDEVVSEVLPQDKAGIVKSYQEQGKTVMMVGDGINDAPALTQADVGCAIGSGSDIAIDSADIVLMKDDLSDVAKAISLSRSTIRNIKQNLFWAFCYNTIGIPIAAGVLFPAYGILLSPMFGALAMSLSSICVVLNALRLRGKKL